MQWPQHHLFWISMASIAVSILMAIGSILLVVLLPADYFDRRVRKPVVVEKRGRIGRFLFRIAKNALGILLIVFGIILALPLIPGPGVLLVLLGLSMVDLPGKFALERRLIGSPMVLRPINLLRSKLNRPRMVFHNEPAPGQAPLRGKITTKPL